MNDLQLLKSEIFGTVKCDFYQGQNEVWMSRRQIGETLGYSNPNDAIKDIHNRHKARLDELSRVVRIALPSGGSQSTTVYSAKGIYEICRWSKQAKADAFYDWVYEVLENLRKGEQVKQVEAIEARRLRAEAMNMNAKTRQAKMLKDLAKEFQSKLASESIEILVAGAAELLLGKPLLPLHKIEKRYTATKVAYESDVNSAKITNIDGLNTSVKMISENPHSKRTSSGFRY